MGFFMFICNLLVIVEKFSNPLNAVSIYRYAQYLSPQG